MEYNFFFFKKNICDDDFIKVKVKTSLNTYYITNTVV